MDATLSTPIVSRGRRRPVRMAVLLIVAGLVGTVLVTVGDALAAKPTPGVKYVDFDPKPTVCLGDPGVSCLPDTGSSKSNTMC